MKKVLVVLLTLLVILSASVLIQAQDEIPLPEDIELAKLVCKATNDPESCKIWKNYMCSKGFENYCIPAENPSEGSSHQNSGGQTTVSSDDHSTANSAASAQSIAEMLMNLDLEQAELENANGSELINNLLNNQDLNINSGEVTADVQTSEPTVPEETPAADPTQEPIPSETTEANVESQPQAAATDVTAPTGEVTLQPTEEVIPDTAEIEVIEPTEEITPEAEVTEVIEPTEEVTPEPTEEITPEAVETEVIEPTEEVTPEPTEEITPEVVETEVIEPTEEVTPEPTEEITPEAVETEVIEPTEEVTPEPTEEITPEAVETEVIEPTEEVTPEPTEEIIPEAVETEVIEPTEEVTPEPTEEITPEVVETEVIVPTEEVIAVPTEITIPDYVEPEIPDVIVEEEPDIPETPEVTPEVIVTEDPDETEVPMVLVTITETVETEITETPESPAAEGDETAVTETQAAPADETAATETPAATANEPVITETAAAGEGENEVTETPAAPEATVQPAEPEVTETEVVTEEPTPEIFNEQVVVTILGNQVSVPYDGQWHQVSGYEVVSISNENYKESDFIFTGAAAAGLDETGIAYMGLNDAMFVNKNNRFFNVYFDVIDGFIEIDPINVEIEITGISDTVDYDGEAHSVYGYEFRQIRPEEPQLVSAESFGLTDGMEPFAEGTEPGVYRMGLNGGSFENHDPNFNRILFHVNDGFIEIIATEDYYMQQEPTEEPEEELPVTEVFAAGTQILAEAGEEAEVILTLEEDTELIVLGTNEDGWTQVQLEDGTTGFIGSAEEPEEEPTAEPTEVITEEKLPVTDVFAAGTQILAEADEEAEVILTLEEDTELIVLGTNEDGWTEVQLEDGTTGFIGAGEAEEEPEEKPTEEPVEEPVVRIFAAGTEILAEADEEAEVILTLEEDTELTVLGTNEDGWTEVQLDDGTTGFIAAGETEEEPEEKPTEEPVEEPVVSIFAAGTEILAEPDKDAEVLLTLEEDTELIVLGTDEDGWMKVQLEDETIGYVPSETEVKKDGAKAEEVDMSEYTQSVSANTVIRAAADGMSEIIYTFREDGYVKVLSSEGDWINVQTHSGVVAYT